MSDVFRTILEKSAMYDFDAVCKLWIGPKLIVFLFSPADVELILSSHVFIDKSAEYDFFKPWLGDGLLISTGKLKLIVLLCIAFGCTNYQFTAGGNLFIFRLLSARGAPFFRVYVYLLFRSHYSSLILRTFDLYTYLYGE